MNAIHEIRCGQIYSQEDYSHFSKAAFFAIWAVVNIGPGCLSRHSNGEILPTKIVCLILFRKANHRRCRRSPPSRAPPGGRTIAQDALDLTLKETRSREPHCGREQSYFRHCENLPEIIEWFEGSISFELLISFPGRLICA